MTAPNATESGARPGLGWYWVATSLCAVAGGGVVVVGGGLFALCRIICRPSSDEFMCTPIGAAGAFWLPCGAWGLALVISVMGGVRAQRRRDEEIAKGSLVAAASAFVLTMIVASVIYLGSA